VGVSELEAQLLPEQKYERIRALRAEGLHVAMVGDGINDAPSLALAHVGIAMGTAGSDVAIEAADIALAANDLRGVVTTVQLSRQALRVVRQNYGMALGVNAGGLLLGAMGRLNPFLAAVLHNLSTLLVVLNSSRLIGYDPRRPARSTVVRGSWPATHVAEGARPS
jgi:cation-transporting P-type ATPase C